MRAVKMQHGRISVVDVAPPDGPGVRVRVSSAEICGSDLHLVENGGVIADGTTLGHEMAGITDDGTPVAIEPLAPCGSCEPCQRSEYNGGAPGGSWAHKRRSWGSMLAPQVCAV